MRTGCFAFCIGWSFTLSVAAQQPKVAEPAQTAPEIGGGSGIGQLRLIFEKTKTAHTTADYTAIIQQSQEALRLGVKKEDLAYGERLMSWAYNRRGESHAAAGRPEDAVSDFSSSAALDPKNWRAMHNLGVSHANEGSFEDALTDFNHAIEIHASYPNSWANRAEIKYQLGKFENAIKDYNEAIRLAPKDGTAYTNRGHAQYRLGHFAEAQKDFGTAVELSPDNAAAWVNLGDYQFNRGNFAEASRDYRQAIRVNPRYGRAFQSAAWLMATCSDEKFRDPNLAIDSAKKAIELDGQKDFRYLDTLAAAYAAAGRFDDAVQTEKMAVQGVGTGDSKPYEERLHLYIDKQPYRQGSVDVARQPRSVLR